MADLSDVEMALVGAIIALLYPAGPGTASALALPVKVFRGMPTSSALLDDRRRGVLNIGVFPVPDHTRNTTRWGVQTFETALQPGVGVSVQGNSAVFSGVASRGDLAGVLIQPEAYVYAAQPGDSAALVAAALGDAIRANTICWVNGATLTVPGVTTVTARTGAPASGLQEWARQEQEFRISVWAPTPQSRDAACGIVCGGLATVTFLELADGTGGRLRYHATKSVDEDQASSIYRRDLIYTIEYGTTTSVQTPTVLFPDLTWRGDTIFV